MKQHWDRIALKIDALSLRERGIIFAMVALIVIMLVNSALLEPRFAQQKQLSKRIKQDQSVMAGLQAQMQQQAAANGVDPNKVLKQRLQEVLEQAEQAQHLLLDMEKSMVSPDKMAALLEDILRQNQGLRLVSLKNLPPSAMVEAKVGKSAAMGKLDTTALVYKHGVEIVVQGGYLDLMNYLNQLEAMPWRLLWAKSRLDASNYPSATLSLTLYTLSLDKKWLNL